MATRTFKRDPSALDSNPNTKELTFFNPDTFLSLSVTTNSYHSQVQHFHLHPNEINSTYVLQESYNCLHLFCMLESSKLKATSSLNVLKTCIYT